MLAHAVPFLLMHAHATTSAAALAGPAATTTIMREAFAPIEASARPLPTDDSDAFDVDVADSESDSAVGARLQSGATRPL